MQFLIDGHNLVPKVAGLSLRDPEDESKLIAILQKFCRIRRDRVSVFFDGALPGMAGTRMQGLVEVISVPRGSTADDAIHLRLRNMKGAARNVTVVSSDAQVRRAAAAIGAAVMDSERFSDLMVEASREGTSAPDERTSVPSQEDVREWLELFSRGGDDADEKSLR